MVSFDDASRAFQDRVLAAWPEAAARAAEHLREVAVSRAPLETGHLKASASVRPIPEGAEVHFPGPYARYQEFGVSHTGKALRHEVGQSFYLTSSVASERQKCLEIAAAEIRRATE